MSNTLKTNFDIIILSLFGICKLLFQQQKFPALPESTACFKFINI